MLCIQERNKMKVQFTPKQSCRKTSAFTLIELLVVIAIIALLLAIVMPGLQKAKEFAKETICRVHLKQWGVCYEMYLNDNDSVFTPGIEYSSAGEMNWDGSGSWIALLDSYYQDPEIRMCPKADRTEREGGRMPLAAWEVVEGGSFPHIWEATGSYAENWWLTSGSAKSLYGAEYTDDKKFKKAGFTGAFQVPLIGDSGFFLLRALESDTPPATDGEFIWEQAGGNELYRSCHDRHRGGVNWVFCDGSARKVDLAELWEIRWHKEWIPGEPNWNGREPWF